MNNELQEIKELFEQIDQRIKQLEEKCKEDVEWPKNGDRYWCINKRGKVETYIYRNDESDTQMFEFGNIFRTEEEALFEIERLKVLRELEKMGRPFEPGKSNYLIHFDHFKRELKASGYSQRQDAYGDFYFKTAVRARQVIEEIGEDRIKKYLFRVGD